jgi:hypothetical protein
MWVWETQPLLRDAAERRTFFEFCKEFRINVIAMQVATRGAGASRQLDTPAEWTTLITEAHRRNMRVHALDGDPLFANPAQHETALSIVSAVVAYNASVVRAARFDGMHLDIEPYLLPEWKVPASRAEQLNQYLDVNYRAAASAHAAGMLYGVDIPFWWHTPDELTGEPVGIVTFRGQRKLATEHLLDFVDNIGIMAYRNVAAGPDGIITHALDTIRRAAKPGRNVRAFVGVETEKVSEGVPTKVTFAGKSGRELQTEVRLAEATLSKYSSFAGIAIHRYGSFRRLVKDW